MADETIASLGDLLQAAATLEKEWGEPGWFRGHSDIGWELTPGVYRKDEAIYVQQFSSEGATLCRWQVPILATEAILPPAQEVEGPELGLVEDEPRGVGEASA